jgi:mRNA interferase RelE/StbE
VTASRVEFDREAAKALRRLSRTDRTRILAAIAKLADQGDIRELVGAGGLYRLRVGDWRVIFRVKRDLDLVQIATVSSRGSACKP